MKLRFYVDIYPHSDPARYGMCAMTQPSVKSDGAKRIAFDVVVPDSLLFHVDGYASEVSSIEVMAGDET